MFSRAAPDGQGSTLNAAGELEPPEHAPLLVDHHGATVRIEKLLGLEDVLPGAEAGHGEEAAAALASAGGAGGHGAEWSGGRLELAGPDGAAVRPGRPAGKTCSTRATGGSSCCVRCSKGASPSSATDADGVFRLAVDLGRGGWSRLRLSCSRRRSTVRVSRPRRPTSRTPRTRGSRSARTPTGSARGRSDGHRRARRGRSPGRHRAT